MPQRAGPWRLRVAAALGKLDAFNLFDPMWIDPENRIYYHLLNSGIRLPARHRHRLVRLFEQPRLCWVFGGFLVRLLAGGSQARSPSSQRSRPVSRRWRKSGRVGGGSREWRDLGECTVRWESHYPVDLVELGINGRVAASANSVDRERAGMWETAVQISHDSWIAARLWGRARNSFDHAIYAHTSPVYVDVGRSDPTRSESSRFFRRIH